MAQHPKKKNHLPLRYAWVLLPEASSGQALGKEEKGLNSRRFGANS